MVLEPHNRRRYPRHTAKRLFVGWKSARHRAVSRALDIGMGGLFLRTPNPPSRGSIIELVFDLKSGEVRARANVRYSRPGEGMGVQFVHMQPADRARLNQFLLQFTSAPTSPDGKVSSHVTSRAQTSASSEQHPGETPDTLPFEQEVEQVLELARNGTYYQLLGVTSESPGKQIKQNFYAIARKFHPDRHMAKTEWLEPLRELMATVTAAYQTLTDKQKRASYDAQLATSGAYTFHRDKTASQKILDDCFLRATELLRSKNYVGSLVWLRKCVDIAPDDAKYHALLARSLGKIPQYRNESVGHFERAIALDPLNIAVYVQLAELYEEMEQPLRARPLYSKILEIDPTHAMARGRLSG
jgi:Flp pilus assembly protein TadD